MTNPWFITWAALDFVLSTLAITISLIGLKRNQGNT